MLGMIMSLGNPTGSSTCTITQVFFSKHLHKSEESTEEDATSPQSAICPNDRQTEMANIEVPVKSLLIYVLELLHDYFYISRFPQRKKKSPSNFLKLHAI